MIHLPEFYPIMEIVESREEMKMREHDACGIGMICNIDGRKTHSVVHSALQIVEKLDHRAGKDASGKVGDGVGILLQISHTFFSHIVDFPLPSARQYGVGMFSCPTII